MSAMNTFRRVGIGVVVLAATNLASAQHNWKRTVTVDPQQGAADHQTIQAAINDNKIGSDPPNRYTVLIYAGTYSEAVTLGDLKENVDLVGVDRDAVIIKPPAATDPNEPVYAITISGSDARNNTILKLTIVTDDDIDGSGHGIVIKHAGTGGDPTNVKIVDVTIKCDGEKSNGIDIEDRAEHIEIRNMHVTCSGEASTGMYVTAPVANALIRDVTIKTTHGNGIEISSAANAQGKRCNNIDIEDVRIECHGTASYALKADGAKSIAGGRRVRIDALALYAETATSGKVSPARKP